MACLNEKANIRVHESNCHSDGTAIGQDCLAISSASFNETEDIIPSEVVTKNKISLAFGEVSTPER
jgi:hypothetical protein